LFHKITACPCFGDNYSKGKNKLQARQKNILPNSDKGYHVKKNARQQLAYNLWEDSIHGQKGHRKKQGAEGEPGANVHGFHGFRRGELSAAYLGTDSSSRLHPKISAS